MGLGAPSEYWAPVQQEIAGLTRVCRFDRAGRGKSDPAPTTPRTCADMVADLRALLHNAGIPAPYVLVGNSLGGMNARLYAYEHPEEVAGLVLVDGSHHDQFARSVEALPEPGQIRRTPTRASTTSGQAEAGEIRPTTRITWTSSRAASSYGLSTLSGKCQWWCSRPGPSYGRRP